MSRSAFAAPKHWPTLHEARGPGLYILIMGMLMWIGGGGLGLGLDWGVSVE